MHVILRLRVEDKINVLPYNVEMVSDITGTIREAITRLKIKNPVFETLVKLKCGKVDYCHLKMSGTVWRFFLAAFGTIKNVEKDYEIFLV
jgi:hypothetical protein